jgi:hypothetical protein
MFVQRNDISVVLISGVYVILLCALPLFKLLHILGFIQYFEEHLCPARGHEKNMLRMSSELRAQIPVIRVNSV